MNSRPSIRPLLTRPGLTVVPECYTAYTALMAEARGFEAVYTGGAAMALMHFGLPDGILEISEVVALNAPIAAAVQIPLIVDADQGGETNLNVYKNVKAFERAGIAAIHIEDSINPKHAGGGRNLASIAKTVERIKAAVDARESQEFCILARTDALPGGAPVEEAIERGNAFAEAGADAFLCLFMDPAKIDYIAERVPIPIVDCLQPTSQVKDTNLKLNIWNGYTTRAAHHIFDLQLDALLETGEMDRRAHLLPGGKYPYMDNRYKYRDLAAAWWAAEAASDPA